VKEAEMKHAIWLLVVAVFAAMSLFAEDAQNGKPQEMSGKICNSACVVQQANTATCDWTCSDNSGPAVFVSDSGKVTQIDEQSQPMCKSHMGKHVKIMAVPTQNERQESLKIERLVENAP
jgi:hypothetical protein